MVSSNNRSVIVWVFLSIFHQLLFFYTYISRNLPGFLSTAEKYTLILTDPSKIMGIDLSLELYIK